MQKVLLGVNLTTRIFPIQPLAYFRCLIFVNITMAPQIERVVPAAPQLYLNRIGQVVPLIIEVDCTIAIVDFLALSQIHHTEIIWILSWIFFKPQPESQNIVKALLKSPAGSEGFLILPKDRILAFETGADQILLHQNINIAGAVFCNIIQN